MRILHTLFSSGFAGTERATAEMCNACATQGHEVMLALRRDHRGAGGASIGPISRDSRSIQQGSAV